MTRPLVAVDPGDPRAVLAALRNALTGDGPAVFPMSTAAGRGPPAQSVEQRVALVVETSGSTGRPKRVVLSADAVLASAAASESALGGPGQWLLALPAHYIAGLNVLVRSITAQTEPVLMDPEHFTAERFVDAAATLSPSAPRYVSLVPTQLARLVDAVDSSELVLDALLRFDRILVGGQATPVDLVARCARARAQRHAHLRLGGDVRRLRLRRGADRRRGRAGRVGGWHARSRDGVAGRVELGGPMLAEGYLDDPQRTDAAFHTDDGRRWYRTDDRGTLDDGVLRVTGRIDDVIVSGGVKVSLGEVELVVRGMPGTRRRGRRGGAERVG